MDHEDFINEEKAPLPAHLRMFGKYGPIWTADHAYQLGYMTGLGWDSTGYLVDLGA